MGAATDNPQPERSAELDVISQCCSILRPNLPAAPATLPTLPRPITHLADLAVIVAPALLRDVLLAEGDLWLQSRGSGERGAGMSEGFQGCSAASHWKGCWEGDGGGNWERSAGMRLQRTLKFQSPAAAEREGCGA